MSTTQTTAAEKSTPTLAHAYFMGYADGEIHAVVLEDPATVRQVVEGFSAAVAAHRVARDAFRSYAAGWAQAEKMSEVRS